MPSSLPCACSAPRARPIGGEVGALIAVLLTIRVFGAVVVYSRNPFLSRDRTKPPLHADQPRSDKLLVVCILATGFLVLPMLAAADVFRLHAPR